jgi:hypothetical protein
MFGLLGLFLLLVLLCFVKPDPEAGLGMTKDLVEQYIA